MPRQKAIADVELKTEELLPKKKSIANLSGKYINHFAGDTYNISTRMAFEWAETKNKDRKYPLHIILVDRYLQELGDKCVLVSYNVKEKKETSTSGIYEEWKE